jgi:hypothetical protein
LKLLSKEIADMTIAARGDTVQYDRTGNGIPGPASMVVAVDRSGYPIGEAPLGAGTDRSGSITLGGTAQVLAAANTARIALVGQNIDPSEDMWINEVGGNAQANTVSSTLVPAKATFSVDTNRAISIVAATTGHKWTAVEV